MAWSMRNSYSGRTDRNGLDAAERASLDELRALQRKRLSWSLTHTYRNVADFKRRCDAIRVHPSDFKELSDLAKSPYTVKSDLRGNYPFGLFAVPRSASPGFTCPRAPPASRRWWAIPRPTSICGPMSWRGRCGHDGAGVRGSRRECGLHVPPGMSPCSGRLLYPRQLSFFLDLQILHSRRRGHRAVERRLLIVIQNGGTVNDICTAFRIGGAWFPPLSVTRPPWRQRRSGAFGRHSNLHKRWYDHGPRALISGSCPVRTASRKKRYMSAATTKSGRRHMPRLRLALDHGLRFVVALIALGISYLDPPSFRHAISVNATMDSEDRFDATMSPRFRRCSHVVQPRRAKPRSPFGRLARHVPPFRIFPDRSRRLRGLAKLSVHLFWGHRSWGSPLIIFLVLAPIQPRR